MCFVSLALVSLGAIQFELNIAGALIALATTTYAFRTAAWPWLRMSSMTLLLAIVGATGMPFAIWVVIAAMMLVSRIASVLAPESGWLPPGTISPVAVCLTAATVVGAGTALTLWARWTPDYSDDTRSIIDNVRELPVVLIVPLVAGFVIVNAITEEIAFRGFVYDAAATVVGPAATVLAQAGAFGLFHIAGFPSGWVGVALASIYGLALGTLRHITSGLRLPVVAHMSADATIAALALILIPA